jgi:hypothetical protein
MVLTESRSTRKGTMTTASRRGAVLPSAPYISFASVLRVLEALRRSGPRDKDVRQFIEDMDKTCATHRIAALRFLGLLDVESVPTPALVNALSTIGTAAWPDTLALTIRTAFRPILALDLANMTLTQLVTAFAQHYAGSEAVLRKSRTFFVHAAIQAMIPLSPGLVRSAKPRAGDRVAEISRNQPRSTAAPIGNRPESLADGVNAIKRPLSLAVWLLSELDTHAMDDNVQHAFWTLLRHIKDQGI